MSINGTETLKCFLGFLCFKRLKVQGWKWFSQITRYCFAYAKSLDKYENKRFSTKFLPKSRWDISTNNVLGNENGKQMRKRLLPRLPPLLCDILRCNCAGQSPRKNGAWVPNTTAIPMSTNFFHIKTYSPWRQHCFGG